ncbi:hypothetical protein GN956_G4933 [Arapaima gigas]
MELFSIKDSRAVDLFWYQEVEGSRFVSIPQTKEKGGTEEKYLLKKLYNATKIPCSLWQSLQSLCEPREELRILTQRTETELGTSLTSSIFLCTSLS